MASEILQRCQKTNWRQIFICYINGLRCKKAEAQFAVRTVRPLLNARVSGLYARLAPPLGRRRPCPRLGDIRSLSGAQRHAPPPGGHRDRAFINKHAEDIVAGPREKARPTHVNHSIGSPNGEWHRSTIALLKKHRAGIQCYVAARIE